MKSKHVFSIILVAVLSILLLACASGGTTVAAAPVEAKLSKYKTLIVNTSSNVPNADTELVQLENLLVGKLRQSGSFAKVTTDTDVKQGVRLDAKIVALREVSTAKRVMLGALAGRGRISVAVELVDVATGKKLGSFQSEGKTSGGTVFAGTTDQAIERVAEQIVDFVKQNL